MVIWKSNSFWLLVGYSALAIHRKMPITAITTPADTKMPEKWLMSPAGGLMEEYVTIAPMIMSINPNSFSATVNPMGICSLMQEPQGLILQSQGLF